MGQTGFWGDFSPWHSRSVQPSAKLSWKWAGNKGRVSEQPGGRRAGRSLWYCL